MEKLREAYGLDGEEAWFQLDGEPIQIKCYDLKEITDMYEALNIAIGKPPASTTSATQPCDIGNCFRGSKKAIKFIRDCDIDPAMHKVLMTSVQLAIERHCSIISSRNSGAKPMPGKHKHDCLYGLLRVRQAIMQSVKRSTVQDSFKLAGIYPFNETRICNN